MRNLLLSCMILVCITCLSISTSVKADSALSITEINFAGSKSDNNCKTVISDNRCGFDKWVEVSNASSHTVDISGWSLRFNQGSGTNEWFVFPQLTGIVGGGSVVVGYTEINYNSVLTQAGRGANFVTYSMLRVSNNEATNVHVALLDSSQEIVDSEYFDTAQFAKQSYKYSLEKIAGVWTPSQYQFFAGNYGTPNIFGLTHDITEVAKPIITVVEPVDVTNTLASSPTIITAKATVASTEEVALPHTAGVFVPVLSVVMENKTQQASAETTVIPELIVPQKNYSYQDFLPLSQVQYKQSADISSEQSMNIASPSLSLEIVVTLSLITLVKGVTTQLQVKTDTSRKTRYSLA